MSDKQNKKKRARKPQTRGKPLLKQLAGMPDKLFTGAFRQQYAALCFRWTTDHKDVEILIITSRDSGRWIIPKGWPMKNKKPHEAAALEALQEAGVRGAVKKKPVGRYTYVKWLEDGDVAPSVVDVFQIEVEELVADFKEKGQRVLEWVSPEEASRRVREIELKSLLIGFHPTRQSSATRRSGGAG